MAGEGQLERLKFALFEQNFGNRVSAEVVDIDHIRHNPNPEPTRHCAKCRIELPPAKPETDEIDHAACLGNPALGFDELSALAKRLRCLERARIPQPEQVQLEIAASANS